MSDYVKIGHARASESGTKYGKPGNQNGKELRREDWYKGFTSVIRAKKSTIAETIALTMEDAIDNKHVGYSQDETRTTLFDEAKKKKFNVSKITKDCNCDCSSLVAVCVNAAGIEVPKSLYTGNLQKILENTNEFLVFTSASMLNCSDFLHRGDILLKNGHCAVVLNDGATTIAVQNDYYPKYTGKSESIADALYSLGYDGSFAHRKKIAAANNISMYIGTAKQNTKMLSLLKQGNLHKEAKSIDK